MSTSSWLMTDIIIAPVSLAEGAYHSTLNLFHGLLSNHLNLVVLFLSIERDVLIIFSIIY